MDKDMIISAARDAVHKYYNCKYPCSDYGYCKFGTGCNNAYDCMECGADDFEAGFVKGVEWAMSQQKLEEEDE